MENHRVEKRFEQFLQIAAITLLVLGCLLVLRPFVTALLCAAVVCFSSWPLYRRLEGAVGGRRTPAALLMTLLLIVIVVLPVAAIAVNLADSTTALVDRTHSFFAQGMPGPPEWVRKTPLVGEALDTAWRETALSKEKAFELLKKVLPSMQNALVQLGLALGEGAIQLALAAFIGFFFYRDGVALIVAVRALLRHVAGDLAESLLLTVGGTVNGVIYGIIGTALAQGAAATIGFLIARVPGALLLGVLTFFFSMLPVGPPLLWGGAVVWLAYQGEMGWAIFMALWGFFVISGIDNVIKPLIISRGSSLPFVLVFLGVFGGALAFGFVGIFLGPTLLAVGFSLVRLWAQNSVSGTPPA